MLYDASALALVLSPMLTGLGITFAFGAAVIKRRQRLLPGPVVLSVLAWPTALLVGFLYPARVWTWWWD